MKFEGEHTVIPLRGIERAIPDNIVGDGAMNEVIGMIARNGGLVPYAPTDTGLNHANDVRMIRVHHTSTGDNIIVVRGESSLLNSDSSALCTIAYSDYDTFVKNGYCAKGYIQTNTNADEKGIYNVRDIIFIGNRMDIQTDEGIIHLLWKNGEYINADNIEITGGIAGALNLPTVEFKVRSGIYDGKKVYTSARYVRKYKEFKSDSNVANFNEMSEWVHDSDSMNGNAMALTKSIREEGGITGYVLVAAAYELKTSEGTSYIMASPVMLMGAPEIHYKDGKFRNNTRGKTETLVDKPNSGSYMVDIFGYTSTIEKTTSSPSTTTATNARNAINGILSQENAYDKLFNMTENSEPVDSNSYADIDLLEDSGVYLRKKGSKYIEGYMTKPSGGRLRIYESSITNIKNPGLFGCKYALYNHPKSTGSENDNAEHVGYYITQGTANILSYKINKNIYEEYKDEINKLVIFMSPIISPYKYDSGSISMKKTLDNRQNQYDAFFFDGRMCQANYKIRYLACGGGFLPETKSDDEIIEDIKNISGLYPVTSIDFNEIKKSSDWIDINLRGKLNSDTLTQQTSTMLKIDDLYKTNILKGSIFGYNGRLHIYNSELSSIQRCNYSPIKYYGGDGQYYVDTDTVIYHYAIEICDKNDSLIVFKFDSSSPAINPLVSYSDKELQSIRIVKRYQIGNDNYLGTTEYKIISDIANGLLGGYINKTLKPIEINCNKVGLREYESAVSEEKLAQDSEYYGKNEIRVSGTYTIDIPNSNVYRIGNGEIIGLARLSISLSQDNYGKFPLIVFCTDGIYTLEVNTTGDGAYTLQSPLSRIICTNKNSICEIDGAVIFASEYGLMMITSDGVKPIAQHINGAPSHIPSSDSGLSIYKNAVSNTKLVELYEDISTEDFIEYIQTTTTIIRYVNAINSVVIYNPSMSYSYILDLKTLICTKIEQQIMFDDNDYPKQTFYIKPKKTISVYIKSVTKDKDGKTISNKQSIEELANEIDVESLLIEYLTNQIKEEIDEKYTLTVDEYKSIDNDIKSIGIDGNPDGSYYQYEHTDDSVFEEAGTTKEEVLNNLRQEYNDLLESRTELSSKIRKLSIAKNVDYGSTELSEEDEEKLAAVGLESVGVLLEKESNKEVNYNNIRKTLKKDVIDKKIGSINTSIANSTFPIGTTKLSLKDDGTFEYGKNFLTTDNLQQFGFTPATELGNNQSYVIETENDNYTSVQFDYYTGKENVPCLLQTRPIKLETANIKSSYRVVLRGTFDKKDGDIKVKSLNNNKFNIIDYNKLAKFCNGQNTTIYYIHKLKDENGNALSKNTWKDSDGNEIQLSDIGLQQSSYIVSDDIVSIYPNVSYAGLYVFGSLDTEHWTLIGAKEKLLSYNRFHDIGCQTHRVSMRYLMVVFVGNLNTSCHIDGFEITSNIKYNNKLK